MTEQSVNDPVAEPGLDATVDPRPEPGRPVGWTPARTSDWAGSPPRPPAAARTSGNIVAAIVLLVVGVALLAWDIPAVLVHISAATGSMGELPSAGNFIRAAAAFLGFFVTFIGVGVVLKVVRNRRD
ncbi:MAG: hypothetical protein QM711_05915 [Micropruina sp.]|uniref:hypothetical protein n=1 Tax=Micropruina sp. TaxID=2737536 RepID=UPI0039E2C502